MEAVSVVGDFLLHSKFDINNFCNQHSLNYIANKALTLLTSTLATRPT